MLYFKVIMFKLSNVLTMGLPLSSTKTLNSRQHMKERPLLDP